MKIIISGGHLTPALALIDFIKLYHPQDEIIFIGRIYSQDKLKQLSQEKNEAESRGIKFYHLHAPRVSDLFSWKLIFSIGQLIRSLRQATQILENEQPDVVMSFGGYLALPIVLAAAGKKIKIITHEQTRVAGNANRLISKFAKYIGLAFAETAADFTSKKTKYIGIPLRMELFKLSHQPLWLAKKIEKPILYVTGGNQGSLFINNLIKENLSQLTQQFIVIHQCGNPLINQDYEAELNIARQNLPNEQQSNYFIKPWITQTELAWIYQQRPVVISRSGANSVAELASYQLPAVLIPLPNSSRQEQQANAEWYMHQAPAQILTQGQFTSTDLLTAVTTLSSLTKKSISLADLQQQQQQVLERLYQLFLN